MRILVVVVVVMDLMKTLVACLEGDIGANNMRERKMENWNKEDVLFAQKVAKRLMASQSGRTPLGIAVVVGETLLCAQAGVTIYSILTCSIGSIIRMMTQTRVIVAFGERSFCRTCQKQSISVNF